MDEPVTVSATDERLREQVLRAPVYTKKATVMARKARKDEVIRTVLEDGFEETAHATSENEWVVTNPQKEQYVLPEEVFSTRYLKGEKEGEYVSIGACHALQNPYQRPITLLRSSGPERGAPDCYITIAVDPENNPVGELYLIDKEAFIETYNKI